ncbi:MAG: hypothetical protein AAF927_15450 [Bacteroidota bacterium]
MEVATIIGEVLKYMVPALMVLIAVKFLLDQRSKDQLQAQEFAMKQETVRQHLPLKFSASERAILFLERISPENLLPRLGSSGKNVQQLRTEMIREIRSEFEHNLSQQLYLHPTGWEALVQTKENVLNLINTTAQEMDKNADALSFSRRIIEKYSENPNYSPQKAILLLKKDVYRHFEPES